MNHAGALFQLLNLPRSFVLAAATSMISASVYLSCCSLRFPQHPAKHLSAHAQGQPVQALCMELQADQAVVGNVSRRSPPARAIRTGTAASSIALFTAFTDRPVIHEASAAVNSGVLIAKLYPVQGCFSIRMTYG